MRPAHSGSRSLRAHTRGPLRGPESSAGPLRRAIPGIGPDRGVSKPVRPWTMRSRRRSRLRRAAPACGGIRLQQRTTTGPARPPVATARRGRFAPVGPDPESSDDAVAAGTAEAGPCDSSRRIGCGGGDRHRRATAPGQEQRFGGLRPTPRELRVALAGDAVAADQQPRRACHEDGGSHRGGPPSAGEATAERGPDDESETQGRDGVEGQHETHHSGAYGLVDEHCSHGQAACQKGGGPPAFGARRAAEEEPPNHDRQAAENRADHGGLAGNWRGRDYGEPEPREPLQRHDDHSRTQADRIRTGATGALPVACWHYRFFAQASPKPRTKRRGPTRKTRPGVYLRARSQPRTGLRFGLSRSRETVFAASLPSRLPGFRATISAPTAGRGADGAQGSGAAPDARRKATQQR